MDVSSSYLQMLIFPLLLSLPHFLIILGGIAFSIFRYRSNPKVSISTIIALLILGITRIVYVLQPILTIWLMESKIDSDTFTYVNGAIGVITSIISAVALGILIFAVWANRRENGTDS